MRTTLTLDDDVAIELERLRRSRDASLKEVVNEALRMGLRQLSSPPPKNPKGPPTKSVDLGRCRFASLDNIGEVLAIAEGEWHR
ncbi:MAG: DUF2191 domain-containing protein [Candidatus Hydrogenedentes bacterium]|nr:DUF2191 domain-containing protein [Candidatus Hydrogenedentota bacterium]